MCSAVRVTNSDAYVVVARLQMEQSLGQMRETQAAVASQLVYAEARASEMEHALASAQAMLHDATVRCDRNQKVQPS